MTTTVWTLIGVAALLWPSRLVGPRDGIPLEWQSALVTPGRFRIHAVPFASALTVLAARSLLRKLATPSPVMGPAH